MLGSDQDSDWRLSLDGRLPPRRHLLDFVSVRCIVHPRFGTGLLVIWLVATENEVKPRDRGWVVGQDTPARSGYEGDGDVVHLDNCQKGQVRRQRLED